MAAEDTSGAPDEERKHQAAQVAAVIERADRRTGL
jgi:hypothetical protein